MPELMLQFMDGTDVLGTDILGVDDVPAGESKDWTTSARVGDVDLTCRVRNVTGPYPFGLKRD